MSKILKNKKVLIVSGVITTLLIASGTTCFILKERNTPLLNNSENSSIIDNSSSSDTDGIANDQQKNLNSQDSKHNKNESQKNRNNNKNNTSKENKESKGNSNNSNKNVSPTNKGHDFTSWNNSCDPALVVINKDNEIPSNFNAKLVPISDVASSGSVKYLSSIMLSNLQKMFSDASKEGISLTVSSGYRSIAYQQTIFNKKVDYFIKKGLSRTEAEIEAAKIVAKPKTSEHHTGLAVDLNGVRDDFYKTKEFSWLMNNSFKYGFVLRYNKDKTNITNIIYEPWHFRYVGAENAKVMVEKNMCLEEYVKYLENK